MAEFAASLIGLISTAEVVLTRVYKYIKHVKHAEQEILDLSVEINGLYGTLKSVSLVLDGFNGVNSNIISTDARQFNTCCTSLDRLRDKLAQFKEGPDENSVIIRKKWKWPFCRSETLDLKRDIESLKSTLSLTLSAKNVSTTLKALSEVQSIGNKVDRVQTLLEAQARISLDKAKEEILRTLGQHNPLRHHQTNVSLRHAGTGTWFVESPEFQTWLHTKNAKLWVYGIPGAGKSILAAAAISETLQLSDESNAVAYFYCDYKDAKTQDPINILGSLAEQIARQSEPSFGRLTAFVKRYCQTERLQTFNCSCENLCELIMDMSSDYRNLTIAVDGLDECGDNVRAVTKHLTSLGVQSNSIRTFISSRDLVDIRNFLDDFQMVSIAATSVDLRLYVDAEIEERVQKKSRKRLYITDANLKGEIMDKLIDGAKGMFRWVAVQLDYICEMGSDDEIRSALRSLPPDLFSSYERLLLDINKKPAASQLLVQRALKWIMWMGRMNIKALREALSVKAGMKRLDQASMPHEERILQLCGSLIRKSTGGKHLESAHFTVKEFLQSLQSSQKPSLTSYGLDIDADDNYFATIAGNYLCCEDFANPPLDWSPADRVDKSGKRNYYPEYSFWSIARSKHLGWARDYLDDPEVFDPITQLFGPSRQTTRLFWLQEELYRSSRAVKPDSQAIGQLAFITPLHEAAMYALPELCSYLLRDEIEYNAGSPLGLPLHCALLGREPSLALLSGHPIDEALRNCDLEKVESVKATVEILISHGTDLSGSFHIERDSRTYSVIYLTLSAFYYSGLDIVRMLIDAGALICEDSLKELESMMLWRDTDGEIYSFILAIEPIHVSCGLEAQLSRIRLLAAQNFETDCDSFLQQVLQIRNDATAVGLQFEKAIEYNNVRAVACLLDNKIIEIGWQNKDG